MPRATTTPTARTSEGHQMNFSPYEYDDELEREADGDFPFTSLRPLHGSAARDYTIRWGDRVEHEVPLSAPFSNTKDILQVSLPKARTCTIFFFARFLRHLTPAGPTLQGCRRDMVVGCGSQITEIHKSFPNWPIPNCDVPLNVDWILPLNSIRGRITTYGFNFAAEFALWLTPIYTGKGEI